MQKIKISKNEEEFIKFIDEYEMDIFTYSGLRSDKNLKIDFLQMTLESLVQGSI